MRKPLAMLLVAALLLGLMPMAMAETAGQDAYASQWIDLRGDWNFKVYRKWSQMYQYLAYDGCEVTWEDEALAAVPTKDVYESWETQYCPAADYATGGLLQMYRGQTQEDVRDTLTENELFPKWSEAWFCKTIEVPAGFAVEDTVTLLLGVIDDVDVVYINGTPVAQSGFKKADGTPAPADRVPELGGFDMAGDWKFEKSYWEIKREYTFSADLLKEGANEIAVRLYNNNSFGGFYDRTMALVATRECTNFLKGLPVDALADSAAFEPVIAAQVAAMEAEDIEAYAATLAEDYNENELDKTEQVAAMQAMFDAYDDIKVEDVNAGYYLYNDSPVYFASRTVTGVQDGEQKVIKANDAHIQYLADGEGGALEKGNYSHCYTVKYVSSLEAMGGKELLYSVYLPPSYYESDKNYPVVYLLHGINSTGDSFINVDHIEERMNEWIASGDVQEMIVVMPNSGKLSGYADTEAPNGVGDNAGPWASHIYVDILAQIDGNYRTLPQKEFRGISGISMGGGGVVKVGMTHTDIYTSFASHMGAVPDISEYLKVSPEELATLDFYLDCGVDDQMVNPDATRTAGEYLESIGAKVSWKLREGAHNSAFYMEGMPASMKMHSDHFVANGLLDIWGE